MWIVWININYSVNKIGKNQLKKKILGIDPGTINCGYAIVEKDKNSVKLIEAGLIKIKTKILQEIQRHFSILFETIIESLCLIGGQSISLLGPC